MSFCFRFRFLSCVDEQELNRGGTAVVYEADDLETSLRVALKVMNTRDGVMTMPIKAVKREIEIASSMTHPNIVRLIDVFAEDTRYATRKQQPRRRHQQQQPTV